MCNITGVIMASGFSRRMKRDKLLLKLKGKPLIEHVIDACVNSKLSEVIIIYRTDEVKTISEKFNIKRVFNSDAKEGQSASIKLGIDNASSTTRGIMFIVGDQPYLDTHTIDLLVDEFEKGNIVIPVYGEKSGNPVIFPRDVLVDLKQLQGDVGGKEIINKYLDKVKYVEVENHLVGKDMDTLEEYEELREEFEVDYR